MKGRHDEWNWRVFAALGVMVLFWGSSYASIRVGLEDYGPGQVALFRLGVASVALALYAWATGMRLPEIRDLPGILILGFLAFTVYHASLNYGELTVSAGSAGVLIATAPVVTALLAAVFLRERLGPWAWSGMGLSFAGAALISVDEGREGLALDPGAFLVLLSAVCVGVYFVSQKPYLDKYGALAFTTYAMWAGTLPLLLVYLPGLVAQAAAASADTTLAMVYLGLLPTAVGYVAYAYAFSRMDASVAASFLYLVPVLSYGIAWLWIGETPTVLSILGAAAALCGVVLVNRRPRGE